jgi:hypothetical protein
MGVKKMERRDTRKKFKDEDIFSWDICSLKRQKLSDISGEHTVST